MANSFVTQRIGQINATGGVTAGFLEQFRAETIWEFMTATQFLMRQMNFQGTGASGFQEDIFAYGETSQFLDANLTDFITFTQDKIAQVLIKPDPIDYKARKIPTWDVLQANPSKLANLKKGLSYPLSKWLDQRIAAKIAEGASKTTARNTGFSGGTRAKIIVGASKTKNDITGALMQKALFDTMAAFDAKDVPETGRYFATDPVRMAILGQQPLFINQEYGAKGSIASGRVMEVAGFELLKTNNIPSINIQSSTAKWKELGNAPVVDMRNTVCLIWNKEAVGTCTWQPMRVAVIPESSSAGELSMGSFCKSQMVVGTQYMREDCCGELYWATS